METLRWPRPTIFFLVGTALALLIYRFGFLGLGWDQGMRQSIMIGCTVACAMSALQIRKGQLQHQARISPLLPLAAGLGGLAFGALLGVGLARPMPWLTLERHGFPGFSLELPQGKAEGPTTDYATGQQRLMSPGGFEGGVLTMWEPGDALDDDTMGVLAQALGGSQARKLDASTYALHVKDMPAFITASACDGRRIAIMTMGRAVGVEGLHRRIASSLRCTPVPGKTPGPLHIPLALADRGDWQEVPGEAGQLTLASESLGASLIARTVAGELRMEVLDAMLHAMGDLEVSGSGDTRTLSGSVQGQAMHGLIRMVACPGGGGLAVLLLQDGPGTSGPSEQQVVAGASCGDSAPWPKAPAAAP